jgi:methylated-DNA-[protein]-cysteine S-methyltransferase
MALLYDSPIGRLLITAAEGGLTSVKAVAPSAASVSETPAQPYETETLRQLQAYFADKLRVFTVPCLLQGSAFQTKVWQALQKIPFGETISYSELATLAGHHKAARAVGSAMAANPLPLIIPCHRVIRSDATLGHYSLGGKAVKLYLLQHEKAPGFK